MSSASMTTDTFCRFESITIGICTGGHWELLEECLHSLSSQKCDDIQIKVWLPLKQKDFDCFSSRLREFSTLDIGHILVETYQASTIRNSILDRAEDSGILYFLDEDCSLSSPSHLMDLIAYHKAFPRVTFIGGRYQNSPMTSSFGRAYNLVCDLWQDRNDFFSRSQRLKHLVGGNLSLKLSKATRCFRFGSEFQFGGEEISYLKKAQSSGYKAMLVNGLTVNHHSRHNFQSFVSRAWLHGNNKYFLERENFGSVLEDRQLVFQKNAPLKELALAGFYLGVVQASYYRRHFEQEIHKLTLSQWTKKIS